MFGRIGGIPPFGKIRARNPNILKKERPGSIPVSGRIRARNPNFIYIYKKNQNSYVWKRK